MQRSIHRSIHPCLCVLLTALLASALPGAQPTDEADRPVAGICAIVGAEDAGLAPLDVWIERRLRRAPTDEILEWMHVIGSHLDDGIPPDEVARHRARIREAMLAAEGPLGFEYHFCKLFALARKPG